MKQLSNINEPLGMQISMGERPSQRDVQYLECSVTRCSVLCYIVNMYSIILYVFLWYPSACCSVINCACMFEVLEEVGSMLQNLGNVNRMCLFIVASLSQISQKEPWAGFR